MFKPERIPIWVLFKRKILKMNFKNYTLKEYLMIFFAAILGWKLLQSRVGITFKNTPVSAGHNGLPLESSVKASVPDPARVQQAVSKTVYSRPIEKNG